MLDLHHLALARVTNIQSGPEAVGCVRCACGDGALELIPGPFMTGEQSPVLSFAEYKAVLTTKAP